MSKGTKASALRSGTWIPGLALYLINNVSLGMLFGFSAWFHQQNQEGQQHLAWSYGTRSTDILTAIPTLQGCENWTRLESQQTSTYKHWALPTVWTWPLENIMMSTARAGRAELVWYCNRPSHHFRELHHPALISQYRARSSELLQLLCPWRCLQKAQTLAWRVSSREFVSN